jgi:hypothetical protein
MPPFCFRDWHESAKRTDKLDPGRVARDGRVGNSSDYSSFRVDFWALRAQQSLYAAPLIRTDKLLPALRTGRLIFCVELTRSRSSTRLSRTGHRPQPSRARRWFVRQVVAVVIFRSSSWTRHGLSSRNMAQQRTNSFRARATTACFLRVRCPRLSRCTNRCAQVL